MSIYQVKMKEWFTGEGPDSAENMKQLLGIIKPRCEECGRKVIKFERDWCLHAGPYSGFFEFTCHWCQTTKRGGDPRKWKRWKRKAYRGSYKYLRQQEGKTVRKIDRRKHGMVK
jgi:hypothetical protein